jgi:uncharacterized protein
LEQKENIFEAERTSMNFGAPHEIRCPIYRFIELSDWEKAVIDTPAFRRLRRIRQLAWTDYVYPGAMHTRFEHSLGVMHMASLLFDGINKRSQNHLLRMGYKPTGIERHKQLIRFAALLHDVGHGPFSHAAEDLFPWREGNTARYKHEHYSAAIVRRYFVEAIDNHPSNLGIDLKAEDVARLLENSPAAGNALFWRSLIDGPIDADRMDYLLRDSHHAGVQYGRYDWQRLVNTVELVPGEDAESAMRVGVNEGGWHVAESLVLARYAMFTQVYFHKTRIAYDHHFEQAMKKILPGATFPPPKPESLDAYLDWDDWRAHQIAQSLSRDCAYARSSDTGRREATCGMAYRAW